MLGDKKIGELEANTSYGSAVMNFLVGPASELGGEGLLTRKQIRELIDKMTSVGLNAQEF